MKQQRQKKYFKKLKVTGSLTILFICAVLVVTVGADSSSDVSANPFYPPPNPDDLPLPASFTEVGTSTSFTSSSGSTDTSTNQKTEVITENRLGLMKNQSATHMVTFKSDGNLKATCLSGNGFELYSKEGGNFPENSTFRSDYGKTSIVTVSSPVSLDITAGTWYFTVFPIGDECSYDLMATQKSPIPLSSSGSGGSFSSSMGVSSISFG